MNCTRSKVYDDRPFLPQLGFGQDVAFDSIVRCNRFLFRVYTPRTLPAVEDDSVFFVGPRFNELFAPRTPILHEMYTPAGGPLCETATYEDCVQHMCWETRSASPFVSASFSFTWAIWDAVRRFENGVKHNVEIAVIDAASLCGKAVTTLQLLCKDPAKEKHAHHLRWCRFAKEAQSVLVHGFIPRSAVLASVPLLSVLEQLPSYFLNPTRPVRHSLSSLHQILAWDFTAKKSSYRKFCHDMTDRYLQLPLSTRTRDVAVSSVHLATTFLQPWLQRMIEDDFELAVARSLELSSLIAFWPERDEARDCAEEIGFMKTLIKVIVEEVRAQKHACQVSNEAPRSQVVNGSLSEQEQQGSVEEIVELRHPFFASNTLHLVPEHPENILPVSSPRSSLKIAIPASPIVSSSSSASSEVSLITPTTSVSLEPPPSPHTSTKVSTRPSPHNPPSPAFSSASPDPSPPPSPIILPSAHPSSPVSPLKIHIPLPTTKSCSSMTSLASYHTALSPPAVSSPEDEYEILSGSEFELEEYPLEDDSDCTAHPSLPETVSCVVTGFLVGAFITLCILSSQRRTLIHLT